MTGKKVLGMRVHYTDLLILLFSYSLWHLIDHIGQTLAFSICVPKRQKRFVLFFEPTGIFVIILLILLVEKIDLGRNYLIVIL